MQLLARSARLVSLFRCPYAPSFENRSLLKGQFVAIEACGFASSAPSDGNRKLHWKPARRPPRISIRTFLKRTESIKSLLQLFNGINGWDDAQTPLAISGLRVHCSRYTVSEVLRLCPCADMALCFFKWVNEKGDFESDGYVYSALIYRLGKAGKLKDMEEMVSLAIENGKASAVTFTTLISAYRRAEDLNGAVCAWKTMLKYCIQPSSSAYTVMIDTYARMKMYEEAGDCYYQLVHSSVSPSIKTCTVLVYHLVEAGKLDAAFDIFNNLTKVKLRANRVTYAYLMMGYAKAGDMNGVLKLIKDFKDYGHSPYKLGESFRSILQYLVREGKIDDAVEAMKTGWPDSSIDRIQAKVAELKRESMGDVSPIGALLQMDMHRQASGFETDTDSDKEEEVEKNEEDEEENLTLFHSRGLDVKSISNVLAFVKCLVAWSSGTEKALDRANVQWDCHIVSEVLDRLKRVNSAWKFYHWVAKKPGYHHDCYTCGKMIRMLLRTGQFARARNLLHKAQDIKMDLPIRTYLNILKHCGLRKQANFAIEVFDKLKASGAVLDESFYKGYIHTLHSCRRHWRLASVCAEMRKAGLSLDKTIYSLLITGFVRAGKLSIAKRLLDPMRAAGFSPDVLMLSDLFKAFHERGKLEEAERVFRGMRQCGMTPAPHILKIMSQVLSTLGRNEEADKLKEEVEALESQGSRAKTHHQEWLLYYHSVFVDSFKEDRKVQTLMAAG